MQETEEIAIEEGEIVEDTTAADANDSVPISEEPSASVEDDAEVNSSEEDYELGDCVLCVTEGGEERPGLLMKAFHNKGSAPRAVTVKWLLDAAAWSRLTQKPEDVELEEVYILFGGGYRNKPWAQLDTSNH